MFSVHFRRSSGLLTTLTLALTSFAPGASSLAARAQSAPAHHASAKASAHDPWWKHAVVYEIYPRSFQDTNGDGTGDLNGITSRMQYLQDLGIDAIWIAPMFPSPQVDFGYDISDYEAVDPQYGTMADFDRLVAEGKKHNIRVCLDMVLNHTSDKHKWFMESASSRNNPKADWYVWVDPKGFTPDGKPIPPNNWLSVFGHSAWEYVPARKQFYYHKFYIQQPDLNWRNPAVERAIFNMEKFWLDKGVAGFRLDAIPTLFEDPSNHDEAYTGETNAYGDRSVDGKLTENLPEVHAVIRRMRAMIQAYPGDRVMIGETYLPNVAELNKWYGGDKHDELHLPMDMQVGFLNKLDVNQMRTRVNEAETMIGSNHPLFVFDNHDNPRLDRYCKAEVVGRDAKEAECAAIEKMLTTLLFTSRATALMYYGDEIGMVTTPPTRKEDVKDPIGVTGWPKEKGRDGDRTPMQWNGGKNAGFTTGTPWLPVPPSYTIYNVANEINKPGSMLTWYHDIIQLRRQNEALHSGQMKMIDTSNNNVLSFVRTSERGERVVVALNFTNSPQTVKLSEAGAGKVTTLMTDADGLRSAASLDGLTLPPYGSWVGSVK